MTDINTPGKPSSVDPDLQDPEEQQPWQEHEGPAPAKADQSAPAVRSATGQQIRDDEETNPRAQAETYLTEPMTFSTTKLLVGWSPGSRKMGVCCQYGTDR